MAELGQRSVVAITGGMGSGKSSVAAFLCEIGGAKGINADTVCRQLLEPGASGWLAVREMFGDRFFSADQRVNRPLLRKELFEDQNLRQTLNGLLHPLARNEIALFLEKEITHIPQATGRFVVEVPLLYEAHWEHDFSQVVTVYAEENICLRRIMLRDSISEAEAEKAIGAQMPLSDKALRANYVIDNSGSWPETCLQILHLRDLLWQGIGSGSQ